MNRCFADLGKNCSALTFKDCTATFDYNARKFNYYDCNFYKSQEQHKTDVENATKRIKSLDTCNSIISFYGLEEL